MKFIFLVTFLFLSQGLYAQPSIAGLAADSTKLFVEYADYKGYLNDSSFVAITPTRLFLGKDAAIYIYQTQTPEDFIKNLKENVVQTSGTIDKDALLQSFMQNYDVEKLVSRVYIKYYTMPDFLFLRTLDKIDLWVSDTVRFNWIPANEFKIINGYNCQKATSLTSKGDTVIAWFTEEIPFSVGPVNVSGLPGLILEYYNPKTKRFFRAVTISSERIPQQHFRKWLTGPIISKSEYSEMSNDQSKKLERFRRLFETNN